MKIKVAIRSLEERIRRHMKKDGLTLRKCNPSSRLHGDFGDYYSIDLTVNAIRETHINLEGWARAAGVLKPFEELSEE